MELHLAGFLAGVSVDILDLHHLGHILDDLHDPVNLVDLDDVDQLLLEELGESDVHLGEDLGVL